MSKMDLLTDGKGGLYEALTDGDPAPLTVVDPNTTDAAVEKHVPVIEKIDGGYKVSVGSVLHPMEEDHWIQFIELRAGNAVYRKYLDPGDQPVATFLVADLEGEVTAIESCNKHGVWSGK